jgi:hypothetical protein
MGFNSRLKGLIVKCDSRRSKASNIKTQKAMLKPVALCGYEICYTLSNDSGSLRAGRSGDRIPMEESLSAPVQTGPGAHPASYTMGTGSSPGGKATGSWS